jgi:hypothetical protein
MQYHEPRNVHYPPQRKVALDSLHDLDRPYVHPRLAPNLSDHTDGVRYSRRLRPQTVSPTNQDRPTGLRRLYGPKAVIGEHMIIPDACFLYPPPDKGRRLGKATPSDQIPRDPVKGLNCISSDMFIRPLRKQVPTGRPDSISHFDLTHNETLTDSRPIRSRKAPPQLDPAEFQRLCETTRQTYKTAILNREEAKKTVNSESHDILTWI